MITVPARRVKQFGVEFYQAGLSAKDIDRLVKFEVLGYITDDMNGDAKAKARKAAASRSRVNWDLLEKRISESENAYQRPIIRRKIDELAAYYRECKDAATLPAIPGAVIITSEKRFTFTPVAGHHDLGLLQIPEEHGVLRVLDGQHRLLALHALSQNGEATGIEVPAVLFDSLDARQIVELFVTINAKHTRLNPSHIISLSGRKLYPDPNQALAHDVIRSLNEDDTSPLHGEIKMLGTGRGRVSQAPLAEEIVDFLDAVEKLGGGGKIQEIRKGAKRFFLNYVKALSTTFPAAWAGRKYSIKTGAALRAFIRAAPDVMARARELRRDPVDLASPLDAATFARIFDAFQEYSVLVFPDARLTDEQQMTFSRRFGPLETTINSIGQERRLHPNLVDLSNVDPRRERGLMGWDDRRMLYQSGNQLWPTDSSFKPVPALASLLSGREVPAVGGETEFVSMRHAYATLPEETRRRLEGRVVVHSILYSRSTIAKGLFDPEQEREQPPVRQALVRANPVNGRKSVYIGSHAWYVRGQASNEGPRPLHHLAAHTQHPEHVYQHRWHAWDLVMWDNRCVLHRGRPWDATLPRRVMRRTPAAREGPTADPPFPSRSVAWAGVIPEGVGVQRPLDLG